MKAVADLTPEELAGRVCEALRQAGVRVTLTGGACVAIWSNGQYASNDLDFIEEGPVPPRTITRVMAALGFAKHGRHYVHPDTPIFVEFPTGPLMVGAERVGQAAERHTGVGRLRLLSPTDCVKDRLAAYFHWNDRQALGQALLVARAQPIDLDKVRRWAKAERAEAKQRDFERELKDG